MGYYVVYMYWILGYLLCNFICWMFYANVRLFYATEILWFKLQTVKIGRTKRPKEIEREKGVGKGTE